VASRPGQYLSVSDVSVRALIQRVREASVSVEGQVISQIGRGMCVFLGVKHDDTAHDARKLATKVVKLRIFPDEEGKMNRTLSDISGELLVVSQFTLYADTSRGNRPSYSQAAEAGIARDLYETFLEVCRPLCTRVASGAFRAHMQVCLVNDGPVTILCDSEK
jgi:D-tyrosyl-tRNA(Tyr) deacylase